MICLLLVSLRLRERAGQERAAPELLTPQYSTWALRFPQKDPGLAIGLLLLYNSRKKTPFFFNPREFHTALSKDFGRVNCFN